MEVYFVKVTEIKGGLQWPLDVYGDVAVRDSLDHKRNYLFRRGRNEFQTLTSPHLRHVQTSHSPLFYYNAHAPLQVNEISTVITTKRNGDPKGILEIH
jgi:hypothetical protein